jgi:hypothetical protein
LFFGLAALLLYTGILYKWNFLEGSCFRKWKKYSMLTRLSNCIIGKFIN